ncbi:MAG: tetratricopeptide repeat protein, partial [Kiritimatiellia bacterium]
MKKMSLILCALIATLVVLPVSAQSRGKNSGPTGTVTTANGQAKGGLRWRNSAKEYTVTNDRGMTVTYSADDVTNLVVDKPVELDPAIKKVMAGGAGLTSAIATLKNIASDYNHLTYDMEATRWLADAYMKQGNATEAVKACEDVIKTDESAAYKGEMAVIYWRALSKSGKASRLNTLLEKAIASGDQTSAASALVARGNAALDRG